MDESTNQRQTVKTCHVCRGARFYYLFSASDCRVVRCDDCGLVFLNPQPSQDELAGIHNQTNDKQPPLVADSSPAKVRSQLAALRRYHGRPGGRLLEVGCGDGEFLPMAEAEGWQVTGVVGEAGTASLPSAHFDMCVISGVMERVRSPRDFLREIHRVLKPGATLLAVVPSLDSGPATLTRPKAAGFKAEHLTCFDGTTIQTLLFESGFREIIIPAEAAPALVFARRAELRLQPVLSVIVPAYNEAATFSTLMEILLRKELPGMQMEIIVVESNSTDGTRELAIKLREHPRVKLILEEQPRGKGHAVRAGLAAASGDFILIQDADLEYDLEDYDGLLEPLLGGRAAFVLGSRHGGRNVLKMRQFTGQRGLSLFINTGHWFFATLINVLFLQRLRDPFTMFKVFRRDCLYALEFECDRFDFDYELLIKLIRKGYRPIELPVNYRSRSFKEGKKVRMFRDPWTWLKALIWLRWVKIDPMAVVEKKRGSDGPTGNSGK